MSTVFSQGRKPSSLLVRTALVWGLTLAWAMPAPAADPDLPSPTELRALTLAPHPRLLATADRWDAVVTLIRTDPWAQDAYAAIKSEADAWLEDGDVPRYEIPDGKRLLAMSRRVLDRVRTLAFVARIEGEPRYVRRAWAELEAAAAFPDWNPSHFLDTAEMTHAFALGYDWLYDVWTEGERGLLREAIITYGLQPGLAAYHGDAWWTEVEHNWNQVTGGGLIAGALAVFDEEPELASQVLHEALVRLPRAMQLYAPDGAWNEGPGYWHYGTFYNTLALSALDTAFGTTFGLADMDGFSETGLFPIYLTGPTGRSFNFADGSDRRAKGPELFWMAHAFERPAYAAYQRRWADPDPLDLLWYAPADADLDALPLDHVFRGTEVAAFRTGWGYDDLFVGFKAGDNSANHSNLDLGTFVLDWAGERWAVDLGADDYNLPGYFRTADQRWTYYRNRAEGQNTLVLDPGRGPEQGPEATADFVRTASTPDEAFAIADLSRAYAGPAMRVRRGLKLLRDRPAVIVQDEVEARLPAVYWWFMHTRADIELSPDGRTATLRQGGQALEARILSPFGRFDVMGARPLGTSPDPPGQRTNEGIRKLFINLGDMVDDRVVVAFTPADASGDLPPIQPIDRW